MNADTKLRQIFENIETSEGYKISKTTSLAGGSINDVYLLQTTAGKKVLKVNQEARFPGMFKAEKAGLDILRNNGSFIVPEVLALGSAGKFSYLLLEYIPTGQIGTDFWSNFAEKLAALHKISTPDFGFPTSNYIGSLSQFNQSQASASDFYVSQRLEPQLQMAAERGYQFRSIDAILKNIAADIPQEPAALIHGDLWNGNYLVSKKGLPCLIDPAVSFGPREMDLAMMKLFGGFPEEVFLSYSEIFPLPHGFSDRIPLWQLYYLLVHLNIFGTAYASQVETVLQRYR